MKLLRLFALSLMMLCAFPALAQDSTPEFGAAHHAPLQILDVTTQVTDGILTLTVHGRSTGCGEPQVEMLQNADGLVIIDLYTETAEDDNCTSEEQESVVQIPLETAIPDTGLTVDINGVSYLINPDGTFGPAFVAPVAIRDLTASVREGSLVISAVGEIDGCAVPVIIRRSVENGAVNARIYRVLSAAMACPAILLEYTTEIEVPLQGDEGGVWVLEVNGVEIGYDFDRNTQLAETDLTRIEATIESVQVNTPIPLPQQLTITVTGYHPDGCRVPTQIRQEFDALTNTLNVRVYRVLPPDVMCPAVIENFSLTIPLEISITEGVTYTINVNGTIVEAEF